MKEEEFELSGNKVRLRKLRVNDADFFLQLVTSPDWVRYIGNRGVHTVSAAQLYLLTDILLSYQINGFGLYCVEDFQGLRLGVCGLLRRDGLTHADLGFAFLPEHTKKGYAREAAELVLRYWLEKQGLEVIDAITLAENEPALNLLKNLGFIRQQSIQLPKNEKFFELFRIHTIGERAAAEGFDK